MLHTDQQRQWKKTLNKKIITNVFVLKSADTKTKQNPKMIPCIKIIVFSYYYKCVSCFQWYDNDADE